MSQRPSHAYISDGNENNEKRNNVSELDCSRFIDDYDILRQFPFAVVINPINEDDYKKSTAITDEANSFIKSITIQEENTVPPTVFCLSNLDELNIEKTPFGNGIVPDTLGNLKKLQTLSVNDSPITKMSEQLGALSNLTMLILFNCSLTYLPNLSKLEQLVVLDAPYNRLSHVDGIHGVRTLELRNNLFSEIPMVKERENLRFLAMSDNALKSAVPIIRYKNLEGVLLKNTTLTFIPSAIDTLQNLYYLELSENKLSHLPTNLLNFPQLEFLNIRLNLLSQSNIQSIETAFKKSHPELILYT